MKFETAKEVELSLLDVVLQGEINARVILGSLDIEDFETTTHREIFGAMRRLQARGEPVDILTVCNELRDAPRPDGGEWSSYVTGIPLKAVPINQAKLEYYFNKLKESRRLRELSKVGYRLHEAAERGDLEEARRIQMELSDIVNVLPGTTQGFKFNTLTWGELVGSEEPELEFVIDGLLPSSCLVLLFGKPKEGKSLLALLFTLSVGLGEGVWGKRVKKGVVLFISTEDGIGRIKERLWRMIQNPDKYDPELHFYIGSCVLTDKGVLDAFRMKVEELKPRLIILDPLVNLFRGKELNSAEDMNAFLRPLQELAKKTEACVLIVHHARKSGSEDLTDVIQGSTTISGVADGLLYLKKLRSEDGSKRVVLEVNLKDAETPEKVVLKLAENLRWEVEGNYEEVESKGIEAEIIASLSREREGLTIKNLLQVTEHGYKPLYMSLQCLEKEGRVRSEKRGQRHEKVYFLKESEEKPRMETENCYITNSTDLINSNGSSSLSRFPRFPTGGPESLPSESYERDECLGTPMNLREAGSTDPEAEDI